MTNDPVNYVRQGALIASALILIQQNEVTCPKVNHFRQLYSKVSHEAVCIKFVPEAVAQPWVANGPWSINTIIWCLKHHIIDQGPFSIHGWARSELMREDITCIMSSLIGWDLAQSYWKTDPVFVLTHLSLVLHMCVIQRGLQIANGLPPVYRQAIFWANEDLLLVEPLGTYFSEIWIEI